MNLTVKIGFDEIVQLVKQLPASKIKQLQDSVNQEFISKKAKEEISSFQDFLLQAPVMNDEQLKEFEENRKKFKQWRTKK
ncbi:hypothetical protein [Flavobacterium pectinovorum]|uniref:hypothetical protein n=1 Tax=Flavobacterium pectinovorum TaxID=29533 RepID=UPI001FAC70D0|nr:hypothetical protein [Flavobacterium pectinovorum]MCI9843789.1 hypothetical protein [Flavobacterium pectinovorum]